MTRKLTTLFAAAAVLGGVGAATTVFGNETAPSPQPPRTERATGVTIRLRPWLRAMSVRHAFAWSGSGLAYERNGLERNCSLVGASDSSEAPLLLYLRLRIANDN